MSYYNKIRHTRITVYYNAIHPLVSDYRVRLSAAHHQVRDNDNKIIIILYYIRVPL